MVYEFQKKQQSVSKEEKDARYALFNIWTADGRIYADMLKQKTHINPRDYKKRDYLLVFLKDKQLFLSCLFGRHCNNKVCMSEKCEKLIMERQDYVNHK